MRGAVFAYHAQNCGGYDYASNDHLAFASDIAAITRAGLPIVSLEQIADCLSTGAFQDLPDRFVGLSCDDGTLLDWHDYEHPTFGHQKSLANILREHVRSTAIPHQKLLTAFVIACPTARDAIDQACYAGAPLSGDDWWPEAAAEGLLAIGNHSLDHVHETLPGSLQRNGEGGNFASVSNLDRATVQVAQATRLINERLQSASQTARVFAYPYGHTNAYLTQEYFPTHGEEHGMSGAFTTAQAFVDERTPCFEIPRFVCGDAWRSPEQFNAILSRLTEVQPVNG